MKYFYFQGRKYIVGLDFLEEGGGGGGSRVGWRVSVSTIVCSKEGV